MNQQAAASQKTRAEQETENEANRLREQVDAGLAIVALRSPDEVDSLYMAADRIERAVRAPEQRARLAYLIRTGTILV